jgi:hypothetical protein
MNKTEAEYLVLLSLYNCLCLFKILSITKKTPGGKKDLISSYSTAKNMPKIAKVTLSSCGLEVVDFRKNCVYGIVELRSNISLKVAELRLQKCLLKVAELRLRTKKKVVLAHLCPHVTLPYGRWGLMCNLLCTVHWAPGFTEFFLKFFSC